MKSIILEVGVNRGQDTQRLLATYKADRLYGFEPVPEFVDQLTAKFKVDPRITIIPKAVDIEDGIATFYVSSLKSGCSSLFDFHEEAKENWKQLAVERNNVPQQHRTDFDVIKKIETEKTRLDTFLNGIEFDTIKFIHCDAQGNDINVLRSLGVYLDRVEAGVIEVTKNVALYTNTDNNVDNAVKFLTDNGFDIVAQKDDAIGAEVNVFFRKKA